MFIRHALYCVAVVASPIASYGLAQESPLLKLEGAVVTLVEQTDVPARVAGVLSTVDVREGDVLTPLQVLARVDDADARLAEDHARLQWTVAVAESKNMLKVEVAEKAAAAANAEWHRAVESVEKYKKSVSDSELSRLQFMAEKSDLEHAQARHEHQLAQTAALVKQNELDAAVRKTTLHQIVAPAAGMVVEIKRRPGEWVEPGMPVARVVRIDTLRVETLIDAARVPANFAGTAVRFEVQSLAPPLVAEGHVKFVSPEANPVNRQVRIWAEVRNHDGRLRPGMQGTLVVMPDNDSATTKLEAKEPR